MHKYIVQKIINTGFECYYVGGFVRDSIMGIKSEDIDLATNAKPHELAIIFAGDKIDFVGETFKVLIVNGIEVATYRRDHYFGGSDKNCKIEYAETIEEDLSRRDLTINALAQCAKTGKIIDPFGGIDDIKMRRIRFVGDPYKRINEDPNRMIRAARFAAKLQGAIHNNTLEAIRNSHGLFNNIAKERISQEIIKAMKIKNASNFFIALHDMRLLQYIFPTLDKCWEHDGGPHHAEDLFTHMMTAGDYLSTRCYILKLAGYLHDIGKVKAYDPVERSFHGHEKTGEYGVEKELKSLKFSNDDINKIKAYIRYHMRNNYGKEKSIRKLVRELNESGINYRSHTRLKCADRAGNFNKPNFKYSEIKNILLKYENLFTGKEDSVFSIKDLKINGNDLIETFDLKPGKIIGDILRFTLEMVYDNKITNDKEDILNFLKNHLEEIKNEY
jgi:tRNA nucleotidyltransferase/poly(A) polymerase